MKILQNISAGEDRRVFAFCAPIGRNMTLETTVLLRALAAEAPDIVGRKKWRRVIFAAYRHIVETIPENGCGPLNDARQDAAMSMRELMRRCVANDRPQ